MVVSGVVVGPAVTPLASVRRRVQGGIRMCSISVLLAGDLRHSMCLVDVFLKRTQRIRICTLASLNVYVYSPCCAYILFICCELERICSFTVLCKYIIYMFGFRRLIRSVNTFSEHDAALYGMVIGLCMYVYSV